MVAGPQLFQPWYSWLRPTSSTFGSTAATGMVGVGGKVAVGGTGVGAGVAVMLGGVVGVGGAGVGVGGTTVGTVVAVARRARALAWTWASTTGVGTKATGGGVWGRKRLSRRRGRLRTLSPRLVGVRATTPTRAAPRMPNPITASRTRRSCVMVCISIRRIISR